MNVKLIRMSSGEDIVADVINISHEFVTIENGIQPVPVGNGNINFAPWSPLINKTKKEIKINRQFVVYIEECDDSVVDQYVQMFSPIITPEKKLIM